MAHLSNDWLTDGLIDFEYKKYILLSYLKRVKKYFNKVELYPFMADLVFHYRQLLEFRNSHTNLLNNFPKELSGIDSDNLKLIYKRIAEDDDLMKELEEIVNYAVPMFKNSLEEGKEIYEFVESQCELSPIGLLPLYTDEGYFFISQEPKKETMIYRYQLTVLEGSNESFRGIHVTLVDTIIRNLGQTYENVKSGLIKKFKELPNPATFLILSKIQVPHKPTLVPVAKRLLVKYISST